jgi:lipoprotein-releasing system permease protein
MYKLLLCWRYLCTRYLAMVCIISVMLGVATLIVVNSVMGGFSTKLKDRLHGLLSDVVIESIDPVEGFHEPAESMMERIRKSPAGPHIAAMSPSVEIFAIMRYRNPHSGRSITRMVKLVGVDPALQKNVGGFAEHLQDESRRRNPHFDLPKEALDRFWARQRALPELPAQPKQPIDDDGIPSLPRINGGRKWEPQPPEAAKLDKPPERAVPSKGIIVGHLLAHVRAPDENGVSKDHAILGLGDDVMIYTIGSGQLEPVFDQFVVSDYIKSEMSEYDSMYVYVPLEHLQHLRTMEGRVNTIQIRLKDYGKAKEVTETLRGLFPRYDTMVLTWEEKQGALLSAIRIERAILNLLLFMIIGVAGFGILAIFSMIVTEKTRDIGILKSLGASHWGVWSIFIGFGLLLGVVGCGLGTVLGLAITYNINEIEQWISGKTGSDLFDKSIYYFTEIPVDVQPVNIAVILLGALAIAVTFSILPAIRAALLHPVRALRYE